MAPADQRVTRSKWPKGTNRVASQTDSSHTQARVLFERSKQRPRDSKTVDSRERGGLPWGHCVNLHLSGLLHLCSVSQQPLLHCQCSGLSSPVVGIHRKSRPCIVHFLVVEPSTVLRGGRLMNRAGKMAQLAKGSPHKLSLIP